MSKENSSVPERRVSACWNACEGISTQNLERRDVTLMSGDGQRRRDARISTLERDLAEAKRLLRVLVESCSGSGCAQHGGQHILVKLPAKDVVDEARAFLSK